MYVIRLANSRAEYIKESLKNSFTEYCYHYTFVPFIPTKHYMEMEEFLKCRFLLNSNI